MCGDGELGLATQLFLYRFDDVVGHEWLPIVLSDVAVRHEAGFAAQVACELAAVVVLHNDRVARAFEGVQDCVAVQRNEPTDLELTRRNAVLGEDLASLLDHSIGRSPANQRDLGITWSPHYRRRNRSFNSANLPHALFHHGAALGWVGEFVTDQDAMFIVFVT